MAKIDKTEQIVLPKSLRSRALQMAHQTTFVGHLDGNRLYLNRRLKVYWS